jgi:DNA anti-recombination protein RmuC
VNGTVSWNYWGEPLLEAALEDGVLKNNGEYDTDFVEQQED